MEPVVSNENTISTGPPGGGGASTLAFLAVEGPSPASANGEENHEVYNGNDSCY